jgi:hypothetical protein
MHADQLVVAATIAQGLNIGVDVRGILAPLHAMSRARILHLLHGLQDSGANISAIGEHEELQEYFVMIVEKAAQEANRAKINRWQDAIIHLATDFADSNFKDNLIQTLADLTEFDLTVFLLIYSWSAGQGKVLDRTVKDYFEHCDIGRPMTAQAIKRLAAHALLDEQRSRSMFGAGGELSHAHNELGSTFLQFIGSQHTPRPGPVEARAV